MFSNIELVMVYDEEIIFYGKFRNLLGLFFWNRFYKLVKKYKILRKGC